MKIIGITGTNGKTTTSFLLAHMISFCGKRVGVIGTLGVFCDNELLSQGLTTPDPTDLHKTFLEFQKRKIEYVVMEVSAHAIALEKLDGIEFEIGAITNITQDHLDFFKTFSSYAKTKLSFFTSQHVRSCFLNVDDKLVRSACEKISTPCFTYGNNVPADVFALDIAVSPKGSEFVVNSFDNVSTITCPLTGNYNVSNMLCAIGICDMLGLDKAKTAKSLISFKGVPGRFNVFSSPHGFDVVVDFAHTPDGLKNVLQTAQKLTSCKIICVFGCGGNRDKTKRAIMGSVAEQYADQIIITSDNPRFENPNTIIENVEAGIRNKIPFKITDRKEAIKKAFALARKGDIVVVCGKGAEDHIEIRGEKIPYCDLDYVQHLLGVQV